MKKLSVILISSLVFWVNINSQTAITPSTGDGSSNNPYQVTTLENLYWAVQRTNTYFIQTADINAADTRNWNSGAGWYPYETYSFHYNGNGYVIDSLFINRSTTDYVGLIGKIFGSYIDNLVLTNVNITGQNYVGGLLGYNSTTNFTNCYVTGKINGSANNVGGLIGYSYYNSEVTNCYSIVDVTGVQYVGGLIGYANQYSTYSNCYSKGSVSSTGTYSGGLFGMCMSSVNNSYSSCDISSTSVGVGGFLGYSHIGANLTNCYSTGSVSGSGTVGGFVGFAFSLDCSNCFWDTDSSGTTTSVGSNNSGNTLPTGKTSIQMRDYTTFFNTGWDFINETKNGSNSYWGFNKEENDGYPFLTMQGYTHNPPPVLAADSITGLELTAATCNFTVYDGNQTCTQYGICWNTTGTPAFSDNYSNEGTICAFGSNTSGLTGLDTNKIYYVRAYVINTVDTGYSNVISFGSFCLPEITTLKVTGITDSTALGNISITKLGIPLLNACGVCWNTVGSPTLNDNYSNQGGVSDTGTYSVPITGLSYNTKYYVRAYAINELDTVYGIDTSFNAVHSEFTASTVIINFGDTLVGLTKQQSFYIKNTSETELNITSINFPFFQYEISPSTADISENDSAFFTLSFTPDTSKNYNGNIIFTSNAGSDTIEVIASAYYQKAIDAGNGISFDGTSNYIEMPHNSSLNPDNFTISFWAKWNGSTGTYQSIITSRSSSPQKGYIIYVSPAGNWEFWTGNGSAWNTLTGAATNTEWTQITATYDGSIKKLYINGELYGSQSASLSKNSSYPLRIGAGATESTPNYYFNGQIDEFRIWNKALTGEEIRSQYSSLVGNEDGLVAYWRFDEESGGYTYDATGNGNTGTLTNLPVRVKPSTAPVGEPEIVIIPNSIDFGNVGTSDSLEINYTIYNTGSGVLNVDSINVISSYYDPVNIPLGITGGDSLKHSVWFKPQSSVNQEGIIYLFSNSGKDSIIVTGKGIISTSLSFDSVSDITYNSVVANWAVTEIGDTLATSVGICWGTSEFPTINDNIINEGYNNINTVYNTPVNGLMHSTKYYMRPFATNRGWTTYGPQISFTTQEYNYLSEDSLDLSAPIMKYDYDTVTVFNTNYDSLIIISITSENEDFLVDHSSDTILKGQNSEFVISFLSSSIGAQTANLIFTSNAGIDTVILTGIATGYSQPATDAQNTFDFNGTSNYIEVPYKYALNYSLFTISFWAKWDGSTGTYQSAITSRIASPARGYVIDISPTGKWEFLTGNGSTWNTLTGPAADNEWTQITATYDGSIKKLYINGELYGSQSASYSYNYTYPIRIGAGKTETSAGYFYNGQIDEMRIWSKVLTQEEIRSQYASLAGNEAELNGYWRFDEDSGNSTYDAAGNNDNGTLYNSPSRITSTAPVGEPVLNLPLEIDLGDISLCENKEVTYKIYNTGGGFIHIDSLFTSQSVFSVNTISAKITSGDSLECSLSFSANEAGTYNDTLIFTSNLGNDTIPLRVNVVYQVASGAGNALDFDGTNDYINIPYNVNLNPDNFTISFWAKWDGSTGTYQSVITSRSSTPQMGYIIYVSPAGNWEFWTGNGSAWNTLTGAATNTEWTQITATYDGSIKKLYINGELYGSQSASLSKNSSYPLRIGAGATESTPNYYFNGQIDEFRIWNKALTQEEIRSQYSSLAGNEDGLVAYWRFDKESGDSIYDATGNGIIGTLYNSPVRIIPSTAPVGEPVLITTMPSEIDFGEMSLFENKEITYKIYNSGGGFIHIDNIFTSQLLFNVDTTSANIYSDDSLEFTLSFSSDVDGTYNDTLIYTGNTGNDTIPLLANVVYQAEPGAGNALEFGGTDDYIYMSNTISLLSNYTVEQWFKTSNSSTIGCIIGLFGSQNSSNPGIYLEISSAGILRYIHRVPVGTSGGVNVYSTSACNDDEWHHVAAVYDGSYIYMYVDGILEATSSCELNFSTSLYPVLGQNGNTGTYSRMFNGIMDEIKIWDKALNQEEICSQYGSLAGNEDGLVAYWRFDEESGDYIYDATGNSNTGTLANSPARIIPSTAPVGEPVISTTLPSEIDFGDISISQNIEVTYKIYNAGGGFILIDSIFTTQSIFAIDTNFANIYSGDSLVFTLSFPSDVEDTYNDTLIYTSSMGNDTIPIRAVVMLYTAATDAGNAIEFDGVDDYIEIPSYYGSINYHTSVSFWAKPYGNTGSKQYLIKNECAYYDHGGYSIYIEDNNWVITILYSNGSRSTSIIDTVSYNEWTHIAFTFDLGNQYKFYMNGELVLSKAASTSYYSANTNMPLLIGALSSTSYNYYGQIDEVRMWQRIISLDEIRSQYGSIDNNASDLEGYWRFDEESGDTVCDITGNVYKGTLYNLPTRVLSTAPIGNPVCTIEPDSAIFGKTQFGDTSEITINVKNTGGGILHIEDVNTSLTTYSIDTDIANIFSGDSSSFTIQYHPIIIGNHSGNYIFEHNMGTDTLIVIASSNSESSISILSISDTTLKSINVVVSVDSIGYPVPTAYGVCYSAEGTPTIANSLVDSGAIGSKAEKTIMISELESLTKYYVRAFITCGSGTYYSELDSVTTFALPEITTINPTNISDTSASGVIKINNIGLPAIIQYGVCWNTTGMPGLQLDNYTNEGAISSTGMYGTDITGLTAGVNYYLRAYAINPSDTVYGEQIIFSTNKSTPEIIWDTPDPITYGTLLSITQLNATASYKGSSVDGTFEYSPGFDSLLNAGEDIQLSVVFTPSDLSKYSEVNKDVYITVNKTLLTVMVNDTIRTYGEENPEFRLSYSGFVNSEDTAVIDILPVTSTTATALSNVGKYEINASGASDNNYSFSYNNDSIEILARTLNLSNFTADGKTYDGTTSVTGTGFDDDRITGDILIITYTAAFENKNVGNSKTVNYSNITIVGGTDSANYTLITTSGITTADITKKVLVLTNLTAFNKTYDGTDTVTGAGLLDYRIVGDDITITYDVAFENKNAGLRAVNWSNFAISGGADSGNYVLSFTSATSHSTIFKRTLTLSNFTADSKVYDGTTNVTGTGFDDDRVDGDSLIITYDNLAFSSENVGAIVSFTNLNISGGTDSANYTLATTSATTSANITKRTLTLSNFTADSKVYDGTTNVTEAGFDDDRIAGDELFFTFDTTFADKYPGNDKSVYFSNILLNGGADAGNYQLAYNSDSAFASILRKELTLLTSAISKIYDGTVSVYINNIALIGNIVGDDINLVYNHFADYTQKDVGENIPVDAEISVYGSDTNCYILNSTQLYGSILPYEIELDNIYLEVTSKQYNGNDSAWISCNLYNPLFWTDDEVYLSNPLYGKYNGTSIGAHTVAVNLSLDGADASNYILPISDTILTGYIEKCQLFPGGKFTVFDKEYDGDILASIDTNEITLTGIVNGEDVYCTSFEAFFESKYPGTGKTVNLISASLSGTDADNYSFSAIINSEYALSTTADIIYTGPKYNIVLNAEPSNAGTVNGSGSYDYYENVTINAVPNEPYDFYYWYVEAYDVKFYDNPFSFNMDMMDIELTAVFDSNIYTLTYIIGEHGETNDTLVLKVKKDSSGIPINVEPDDGYYFAGWSDGVKDNPRIDSNVTSDITVTAIINEYLPQEIIVTYDWIYDSNIDTSYYYHGDGLALEAYSIARCNFVGWTINGDTISKDPILYYIVDTAVTIVANYIPDPKYTLTVLISPECEITINGSGLYWEGENVNLQSPYLESSKGWIFKHWMIGDSIISTNSDINYLIPDSNVVITANYLIIPEISVDNNISIEYGTPLNLSQFNPTANVEGTFNFSPELGTILNVNSHNIQIEFIPDNPDYCSVTNYSNVYVYPVNIYAWVRDYYINVNDDLPEFEITYTGFVNNEDTSIIDVLPVTSFSIPSTSEPGLYNINLSGGSDDNYTINFREGTLTITDKIIPVITWDIPAEIVYGTVADSNLLNASSNVEGTFVYDISEGMIMNAGKSGIIAYFTPEDLNTGIEVSKKVYLFVNKAPLTAKANDYHILIGDELPKFSFSYSGFVGDDDASKLIYKPVALCSVSSSTVPGVYTINATGAYSNNYDISYENGTLTISEKYTPEIIWDTPEDITYGNALSETQLNAVAIHADTIVPGTFVYNPSIDSVLNVDDNILLSVAFIPNNTARYYSANKNVNIKVNKATLNVSANAVNRAYGDENPELTISCSGFVNSDNESVLDVIPVASTIAEASSNVGKYEIVASGGIDNNYEFVYHSDTLLIEPRILTVINSTIANRDYNGTTEATISGAELVGVITGDDVTLVNATSGKFAQTSVGTGIPVTTSMSLSGTDAGNYTLTQPNGLVANITAKELTVTGAIASNKVYDGTTIATINDAELVGVITGDDVILINEASGTFVQTSAGTEISVTTSMSLSGTDANNYILTQPNGLVANITAKELTVSVAIASNKVYDGTTIATINDAELVGVITGDDVTLINATSGTFAQINIGTGIAITTLMSLSGTDAGNYILTQPNGLVANITAKELTVTGAIASNKEYDGTTTATISGAELVGVIPFDNVTLFNATTGTFAQANSGTGITINTSMSLSGTNPGNYTLTQPTLTADITKKILTVGVQNEIRRIGEDNPQFILTFNGFVSDEDITIIDDLPSVICLADVSSPVGDYDIVISEGSDNNYDFNYVNGILTITDKIIPVITWSNPDAITYGTELSTIQLNASSGTAGSFTYYPDLGSILNAGTQQLGVTFTPYDTSIYAITNKQVTIVVNKAGVTISGIITSDKKYDGTTAATISGASLNGIISGDDVTLINATSGTFAQSSIGMGITITTSFSLSGTDAGNYTLIQPSGLMANITAKELTVNGAIASNKEYDRTTTAIISGAELAGVIAGDDVLMVNATSGTFAQINIGTGIPVTTSISLSGTDAGNYTLTQPTGLVANISKKELTVPDAVAINKEYNGTTAATISGTELVGVITGDNIILLSEAWGTFAQKDVGTGISVNTSMSLSGTDAGNYTLIKPVGLTADITAKELTVSGAVAADKVYDGTTAAAISGAELVGGISGDDVILINETLGKFAQSDVGTEISVTTFMSLSGNDAGNYIVSQPILTANIVKKTLTVGVQDEIRHIGEDNPQFILTFNGFVSDEDITVIDDLPSVICLADASSPVGDYDIVVSGGSDDNYNFDYENGIMTITDKVVPVITWNNPAAITYGTALSSAQLNASANTDGIYTYSPDSGAFLNAGSNHLNVTFTPSDTNLFSTVNKQVSILVNKAVLTISGAIALNKAYNGTNAATISGAELVGIVDGDDVTIVNAALGTFAQSDVGTEISVTSSMSLSGSDAGNYTLVQPTGLTASITKKELTVTGAVASDKVYDRTTTVIISGAGLSGVIAGDNVTLVNATSGTFAYPFAASNVLITTVMSLSGADTGNYRLTQPTWLRANIYMKELTVSGLNATNKVYDGTNVATINATELVGVISGDNVILLNATSGIFAQKDVGTSIIVTPEMSLSGTDAPNYVISQPILTADITKKILNVSVQDEIRMIGEDNPEFTLTFGGFVGNEDTTVIDELPSVTCSADASSPVGEYDIIISGGTDNNYDLVYSNGNLTVTNKIIPVITWNNPAAITYGTVLSTSQLNASSSITGSFAYTPDLGSILKAGTHQLSVIFTPSDINVYSTVNKQVSITVNKAGLSIAGIIISDKEYDGTNIATINGAELLGVIAGDDVSMVNANLGTFAKVTVGDSILVTTLISISGTDAGNYTLTQPTGLIANITAKELTVSGAVASSKEYDGTNIATINGAELVGIVWVDDVILVNATSGAFAQAGVGKGIAVTTSMSLTGFNSGNYILVQPELTANITAKELTVSGALAADKVYDGTTAAAINSAELVGAITGDDVILINEILGTFAQSDVGTGIAVTTSMSLSGNDAGNYIVSQPILTANIVKKTLTVGVQDEIRHIGEDNPEFTLTFSGFAGTEDTTVIDELPLAVCSADGSSPVGDYDIVVSGGSDNNYNFTYVNGIMIITDKVIPVITWSNPVTITYGTALSSAQLNASSSTSGLFAYTPDSGSILNAGTHQLTVIFTPDDTSTYANRSKQVSIIINKAELVVTPDDKTRVFGESNPVFTISYSGFTNDENASVIDILPMAVCAADTLSEAGEYDIFVSGGSDNNYSFVYNNGILTINPVVIEKIVPDITWNNPDAIIYGTGLGSIQLNASANTSGTFTYSPLSGTILAAGTHQLSVTFFPNDTAYTTATKQVSVTVSKAILSVSADNTAKVYGQENPAFTISYTGFVNNENVSELTTQPSALTEANLLSNTGTYTINVSGGVSDNYQFEYTAGTLAINKATLNVGVENASRKQGENNPVFKLTYNGFENDDDENDLDTKPNARCTANQSSPAGTYTIIVNDGEDNNYDMVYTNGILTVTPVTSVSLNEEFIIKVYPNPFIEKISVSIDNNCESVEYIVLSVNGAVIQSGTIDSSNGEIDFRNESNGIFILLLKSENIISEIKLFKE